MADDWIEKAHDSLGAYADAFTAGDLADNPLADLVNKLSNSVSQLLYVIEEIETARSNHPTCGKHPEKDSVTCGWKVVVRDIDNVLERAHDVDTL